MAEPSEWHEAVRGGLDGGHGKVPYQRVVGIDQADQGGVHNSVLPELTACLDTAHSVFGHWEQCPNPGFGFQVVLGGAEGWTQWSLWVLSNVSYSVIVGQQAVILLKCGVIQREERTKQFVFKSRGLLTKLTTYCFL